MYIFVFMWTPSLQGDDPEPIHHGWIFASFMLCMLIGSHCFAVFVDHGFIIEKINCVMLAVSAVSLLVPLVSENYSMRLFAFCVFEICCGLYFPSIGMMRSRYVPEDLRATIMNFFRVPLNGIVVTILLNIEYMNESQVFASCGLCLVVALGCQLSLAFSRPDATSGGPSTKEHSKGSETAEMQQLNHPRDRAPPPQE